LGIRIRAASSPQAKGRVERNHGTDQDRLVKKLRRLGLAEDATTNQFLATTYWPAHNARFAQLAAASEDFHGASPSARELDRVFRLEETRVVGHDWVVRYHNRALQLQRQSGHAPARSTVTIAAWEDGRLAIEYRGHPIQWTEITGQRPVARGVEAPASSSPPAQPHRRPRADHPWRQGVTGLRQHKTLWQAMEN
jgi:hypothetical protein